MPIVPTCLACLLTNDLERVIETLVEVWTEELVSGGRIEIEHFLVPETHTVERAANRLLPARRFRRVTVRGSKRLRKQLNEVSIGESQ